MNIVVLYASQKGSTAEIASHIASGLGQYDIRVKKIDASSQATIDARFDACILLSPIY